MPQNAYPGTYRENPTTDSFWEIHFALLDISISESTHLNHNLREQTEDYSQAEINVEFAIVSHRSETVIRKTVPLRHFKHRTAQHGISTEQTADRDVMLDKSSRSLGKTALLSAWKSGELTVECVPHRGKLPLWSWLKYRAIIACALLVLVVLPLLVVVWLVSASIYYVCIGSELARRDRIERQYRELKKSS